ncbi:MAG: hypothetical protein IPI21_00855 [Propionivibrio sp.]|nr:hypothetical protein [Propionivibrio sp.]
MRLQKARCSRFILSFESIPACTCYASLADVKVEMGDTVDLAAIIASGLKPLLIEACGLGWHARHRPVLGRIRDAAPAAPESNERCFRWARAYRVRIIGPRSFGLFCPRLGLNLTPIAKQAPVGNIALISQSSTICASILDWSYNNEFGFSSIVSLGNAADLDFAVGSLITLAMDINTSIAFGLYGEPVIPGAS